MAVKPSDVFNNMNGGSIKEIEKIIDTHLMDSRWVELNSAKKSDGSVLYPVTFNRWIHQDIFDAIKDMYIEEGWAEVHLQKLNLSCTVITLVSKPG